MAIVAVVAGKWGSGGKTKHLRIQDGLFLGLTFLLAGGVRLVAVVAGAAVVAVAVAAVVAADVAAAANVWPTFAESNFGTNLVVVSLKKHLVLK